MMKKALFTLVCAMSALCSNAQLVVAEECKLKEGDLTARRMNDKEPIVMDGDTVPYAIVRVGLAEPNATFDNRWVLKQEYNDSEYWVYIADGVRSVTIKTKRFTPLHYKFPEPLQAKNVYTLMIHKPEGEKYKGTLNISSNVADADVYVDGTKVSDGTPFTYTGEGGMHTVELKAEGYDPQARQIDLPMGQQLNVTINLFAEGSLSVDGVGYGMVPIPAATFSMGDMSLYYSKPVRNVSLRPFSAGSMLVSADLWEKVMDDSDSRKRGENGEVVNVSYDEVQDFISALNAKTGKEFRLPTEAEWEYLRKNAERHGISDIGSKMEWCGDWFGQYTLEDSTNPQGPSKGIMRSVRGGSEYTDMDPTYSLPYYRWRKLPEQSSEKISFRLVED